jgi:hypothetical protein
MRASYSGTPLPQKLGIKPGLTVVTINAPTNYRRLLGTIPEGVTFSDHLKPDSSFVHVFINKRSELEKQLAFLREKIAHTGTVWIFLAEKIIRRANRCNKRCGSRCRSDSWM